MDWLLEPSGTGGKLAVMVVAILLFVVVMGLILFLVDRPKRVPGWVVAIAFAGPAVVMLAFGLLYPGLRTIRDSFYNRTGSAFVGLDNYVTAFTRDEFQIVLRNTAIWVIVVPLVSTFLGLVYAVVVDREIQALTGALTSALEEGGHPKVMVERTALALLSYIEQSEDGFRILVRDSPVAQATGTFSSLIGDVASQVEHLLAAQFKKQALDPSTAPMYAQMLVGMVALTGQWWLDARSPKKAEVAAHLVNLAWNGLEGLERRPALTRQP